MKISLPSTAGPRVRPVYKCATGTAVVTVQPGAIEATAASSDGGTKPLEVDLSAVKAAFVETKQAEEVEGEEPQDSQPKISSDD